MMDFEIKNDLAEIESLTEAIASYYRDHGIAETVCYDVRLAIEEAVSNTIKYGYQDHQAHIIHVHARLEETTLVLEIEDDGAPFNPLEAPAPDLTLSVEEKPIGHLGIYLLRSVMDQVDYKRTGSKNILRMIKIADG
jgi:anti-sigma regulatory factor (Ser/Thr protein kinase)